jgi:hypothetical protein
MVIPFIGTCKSVASVPSAAARMGPGERRDLSVQAMARGEPIATLAWRHGVSRQFVHRQKAKATAALDDAFAPASREDDVLFDLPVTKDRVRQLVMACVLSGHAPFRGVQEIIGDVLGIPLGLGTIHNIVQEAVAKARTIQGAEDLSGIRVGAHDEIYQAGDPVLAGVDLESTYCYLLQASDACDEDSWGISLLEASDRGLRPSYTIGDGGHALRAGQRAAWGEGIPCHGDVFHAERDLGTLAYYLENRAQGAVAEGARLERKMTRAKRKKRGHRLATRLALARAGEAKAVALARDVRTLSDWMQRDILAAPGPDLATRRELFDYVLAELRTREPLAPHRIGPVLRMLENHRDRLLAFAGMLDERLADIAARVGVPAFLVHAVCETEGLEERSGARWRREADLRGRLGHRFHDVQHAVREALAETHRASSLVENLNSRLRSYFFLRRHIGNGYLDLLRFYLNHRRYLRSEKPERIGKSPKALLTGEPHPHWLELLGFTPFRHNAA